MPWNTPERFSLRLGWKHCTLGEKTIAYVLFKCYNFSSSGFYLSFYWATGEEVRKKTTVQCLLLGALLGKYLRNRHMCTSYIHLYKSTTYKILSKGLLEPVCNWFGQVSVALVGVWLLRRSQATSLMCLRHLLGSCIRWRLVYDSAKACNAIRPASRDFLTTGWGFFLFLGENDFLKWLSRSSQAVSPVKKKWAPSRSRASTPGGKLKVRVTVDQSVTLQP